MWCGFIFIHNNINCWNACQEHFIPHVLPAMQGVQSYFQRVGKYIQQMFQDRLLPPPIPTHTHTHTHTHTWQKAAWYIRTLGSGTRLCIAARWKWSNAWFYHVCVCVCVFQLEFYGLRTQGACGWNQYRMCVLIKVAFVLCFGSFFVSYYVHVEHSYSLIWPPSSAEFTSGLVSNYHNQNVDRYD